MRIDVLTLFPEMFQVLEHSILGRAGAAGLYSLHPHNIRDYSTDRHRRVDDSPYGGGFGMVLACQPIMDGIKAVKEENPGPVIFLGPRGKPFTQEKARQLAQLEGFTLLCGHYEGIDERIYSVIDEEISLGDFILTGGEMAALPLIDAVVRLIPGVLGSHESTLEESFSEDTLEYPQYTKPAEYQGMKVPEVLLSGHHEKIRQWRRYMSLELTREQRPDLYARLTLTRDDQKIFKAILREKQAAAQEHDAASSVRPGLNQGKKPSSDSSPSDSSPSDSSPSDSSPSESQ